MFNLREVTVSMLVAAALAGCASGLSGSTYTRDQARQVEDVRMATVESVREVLIEGTKSSVGTAAGAMSRGMLDPTCSTSPDATPRAFSASTAALNSVSDGLRAFRSADSNRKSIGK